MRRTASKVWTVWRVDGTSIGTRRFPAGSIPGAELVEYARDGVDNSNRLSAAKAWQKPQPQRETAAYSAADVRNLVSKAASSKPGQSSIEPSGRAQSSATARHGTNCNNLRCLRDTCCGVIFVVGNNSPPESAGPCRIAEWHWPPLLCCCGAGTYRRWRRFRAPALLLRANHALRHFPPGPLHRPSVRGAHLRGVACIASAMLSCMCISDDGHVDMKTAWHDLGVATMTVKWDLGQPRTVQRASCEDAQC